MAQTPEFPAFKSIELEDYDLFTEALTSYRPRISELTFTNLFIWRSHYRFQWSLYKDWLLIIGTDPENGLYAMEPVGPPSRREVTELLLTWMKDGKGTAQPRIERSDGVLRSELEGARNLVIEPTRDHFDYVYLRKDLVELAGNKYRSKRNHINKLLRTYSQVEYLSIGREYIEDCLDLQEKWCSLKRCDDDLSLMAEWEAIREILAHIDRFPLRGGVLLIDGKVEAFTLGEPLTPDTAVIHIEKANAEIPGLYALVNQRCCEFCWDAITYINREQDLGMSGLREAKLSYYPNHFVEKFRITLR
jgi:uncharacterized protein